MLPLSHIKWNTVLASRVNTLILRLWPEIRMDVIYMSIILMLQTVWQLMKYPMHGTVLNTGVLQKMVSISQNWRISGAVSGQLVQPSQRRGNAALDKGGPSGVQGNRWLQISMSCCLLWLKIGETNSIVVMCSWRKSLDFFSPTGNP